MRPSKRNQKSKKDSKPPNRHERPVGWHPKVTPGLIITPGATVGMTTDPSFEPPVSNIPQEADQAEINDSVSMVHAASPNGMRLIVLNTLESKVAITDEEVRVYDKYALHIYVATIAQVFPATLHLFLVKGPNAMTVTPGDHNPGSGVKTAIDAACANGSEIKHLPDAVFYPIRDGAGTVRSEGFVTLDLKDHLNSFTSETEKALAQGRNMGKYYLCAMMNASVGTSTFNIGYKWSYHTRNRRIIT